MNLRPLTLSLLVLILALPTSFAADACGLLTKEEIRRVQGEDFQDAKSSSRAGGELAISQCFYVLPTFSKSVSLELAVSAPDAKAPHSVRKLWDEQIASSDEKRGEEEERERGEGAAKRLVQVRRVGDQAFWVRGGPSGALYALSGERWLRISLGGSLPEKEKIAHARQLARIAIKRMNRIDRDNRAGASAPHR